MCYMLYGAINQEVSPIDYARVCAGSRFAIRPGTRQAMEQSIEQVNDSYRVTAHLCDCDFPFGTAKPDAAELTELSRLIQSLRTVRNAKCVYLCKTWTGDKNESQETVHIDDIDLPHFLAGAKTNCLYRIDLYRRHY